MRLALFFSLIVLLAGLAAARADWLEFRGPHGDGHADGPGIPLTWSETENVTWKTPIPFRGWSTPVAMAGRVWLTTATLEGHDFYVLSIDAETGRVLLNERLFHADNPEPLGNPVNGYASPSPAAEPGRVYVHFGSYGTACLDPATGKPLWERTDIPCRHYRGPGSSLILFENLLILTMDGVDIQYTIALDKKTGRTVWKTDRTANWDDLDENGKPKLEGDLRKAYSTPFVADVGGRPVLLSAGAKAVYGYDPRTGKELWKVRHLGYSGASRPLLAAGLALFMTGSGKSELLAVRPESTGDVTDTGVAWRMGGPIPRTASPILVDGLFTMVTDDGMATCLDPATGQQVWRERLPGNYAASPVYSGGRLYFANQQGKTTVLKPGRAFEVLATNVLDAGCMASPAISDGALFLRTKTHLYRIEGK